MNRAGVPATAGRSRRRAAWAAAGVIGVAAAAVAAEQVTVQRPAAPVRDAKGAAGEVIDTVARGATLEVLGHEGHWLRVRTAGGKVGYVPEAVALKGSDTSAAAGLTGGNVSPTDAGAAGRGNFDGEVKAYAGSKGLDFKGLERMEATRAAVEGRPLKDFEQQGHVGGGRR